MGYISLSCPQCGAVLTFDAIKPTLCCEACGFQALDDSPLTQDLIRRAREEASLRNRLEAAILSCDYLGQCNLYAVLAERCSDKHVILWNKIWRVLAGDELLDTRILLSLEQSDIDRLKEIVETLDQAGQLNGKPVAVEAFKRYLPMLEDKDEVSRFKSGLSLLNSFKKRGSRKAYLWLIPIVSLIGLVGSYLVCYDWRVSGIIGGGCCAATCLISLCVVAWHTETALISLSCRVQGLDALLCLYQDGIAVQYLKSHTGTGFDLIPFQTIQSVVLGDATHLIIRLRAGARSVVLEIPHEASLKARKLATYCSARIK